MTIELIRADNFDERVIQATKPVIIDFWLDNCPPCQTLEPRLEQVARRYQDRVQVYRLDIAETPSIPDRYDILSVPTLLFFKNGAIIKRLDGLIAKPELEKAFEEVSTA